MFRKVDYLLLGIAIIAIVFSGIVLSITISNSDQISELSAKIEELKPAPGPKEVTVKIGAPLAKTGWVAYTGEGMEAGYKAAAEAINEGGGIPLGENTVANLDVIVVDTKSTPDGAIAAVRELIDLHEVDIMLATTTTSTTKAILPQVKDANLFTMITSGSEHPYIRKRAKEMGIKCFATWLPSYNANNLRLGRVSGQAIWAVEQIGPRVTCLEANVDWGRKASEYLREGVEEAGGTWLGSVTYEAGAEDLSPQISEIKQKDPDVVFTQAFGPTSFSLVSQCRDAGLLPEEVALIDIATCWPGWVADEYVGPDVMTNTYNTEPFSFPDVESASKKGIISKERTDAWEKAKEEILKVSSPDKLFYVTSMSYMGIMAMSKIIEKAGSTDTEDLASAASELTVEELNKDPRYLYKFISPTPPFDEGEVFDEYNQAYIYQSISMWKENYEWEFIDWVNLPE